MKPNHVEPKMSELRAPLAARFAAPGMFGSSWNLRSTYDMYSTLCGI